MRSFDQYIEFKVLKHVQSGIGIPELKRNYKTKYL